MTLSDKMTSLADESRKLLQGVSCKLSIDDMITILKLKNSDAKNQYHGSSITVKNVGPWSQEPARIGLEPGCTYIICWDSTTTGDDKQVSLRIYNSSTNQSLKGGRWGGIFVFPTGPQTFIAKIPQNLKGQTLWMAKNIDGDNGGDSDGVTTFKDIRIYKLGGVASLPLFVFRGCAA